jgi:hypothetical protein
LTLNIEKYFQSFFDKISDTIIQYKILKKDEARRLKIEKQQKKEKKKLD